MRHPAYAADACQLGCQVLQQVQKAGGAPFIPTARALLFYRTIRAGAGLGFEAGSGFLVTRMPFCAESSEHGAWSPPCFLSVHGVECGAVLGAESVSTVCGVMSEMALSQLMRGGKLAFGADFSVCLGAMDHGRKKHGEVMFGHDFCCAAANSAGSAMLDVGLTGCAFHVDQRKNEAAYGAGTTASDILEGEIATPAEMKPLIDAILEAARAACGFAGAEGDGDELNSKP